MRTKRQKVDAVLGARDLLEAIVYRTRFRKVPNPLRDAAKALLAQFPAEDELRPLLEAGLQDAVPEPPPRVTMTDWVRNRYRNVPRIPDFAKAEPGQKSDP